MIEPLSNEKAKMILQELQVECESLFEFKIQKVIPIHRGWLNLKWKLETDVGNFVLKQYNKERYKLYDPLTLLQALQQQQRLHNNGVRCPKLLTYKNNVMHISKTDERFIVLEHKEGNLVSPGKVNEKEIHSLGQTIGHMHKLLNDGTLIEGDIPKFVPPTKEERLTHWEEKRREAEKLGKEHIISYIKLQQEATQLVNVDQFYNSKKGWVHRDLWVDNFLFYNDKVSAILDFDRMDYDYVELDIGRAVISCALHDGVLNKSLVASFLEGYRNELDFPVGNIVRTIQMLWYMESTWWIHANMDQHSVPPSRFADEMNWIAKNYGALHSILADL
ncbi:phosphotransferase [Bacillus cereus]|uniref:phosphotransferase enzyme family protein n=1 Tax=Bacillus cereus group TaxID=86661 RepID=UPI000B4A9FB6|nr:MULTISPECIES: phosphotransferase [Bacillus cereus group]MDA1543738.1 phosphotransferase [Bacillus cereus group sp. TH253LC]MDA1578020.1 phosphotransferase [Bacillus cereus group sp. TH228LC]MDA1626303.1 phosphotransferase [Bacillus cereus group sp. TH172LC]MDA1831833.1 phosphotransferase [Bacillus cereus group sp. BY142LC]MEC2918549.1 phosphotransferase [Bacillus tropicus]